MTGVLGTLWKGAVVLSIALIAWVVTPALTGALAGALGIRLGFETVLVITILGVLYGVGRYA